MEDHRMHTYLRNKPVWVQLITFGVLTVGILLLVGSLGLSLVARFNHLSVAQIAAMGPADYARPELSGVLKGELIIQFLIFFLPSMLFAYLADPRPLSYIGLKSPQKKSFLPITIITIVVAFFTVSFLGTLDEAIVRLLPKATQKWIESGEDNVNGMLDNILTMKSPADMIMPVFLVGILAAVGEEVFFRGILQKFFIQMFKSAWPGIIFTGFLFSAIHMQFMGFLPRMALGIVLGSLYWFSGSLYLSILGHFIFNFITLLLLYFKVADLDSKNSSSAVFIFLGILSLAIVVYLLNLLRKKSTTTYAAEFPRLSENSFFDDPDHPV
ncbi:MAG TPA: CPBP family intramembrane glutamic endopeptidase [Puia sp.]|nr:CPBP family intramembrane glutamic endopeptidase [Puia sp.]